jgi:S-adenosylmethionine synthetase
VDKVLLAAGEVERTFGSGRIVRPITLYAGDRVTTEFEGRRLAVAEAMERAARGWFQRVLPHLDLDRGLRFVPTFGQGSTELVRVVDDSAAAANDTSAAVGYAPLTPLEHAVLWVENMLNGDAFKHRFPATGQDVKVMAVRRRTSVALTVSMPFLAPGVRTVAAYVELREAAREAILRIAAETLPPGTGLSVALNAADDLAAGGRGAYLTLSGTSAEHGDSGEVGRGNRVSGLISLMRPGGAEAACGKNPRSHVGKIYSALAFEVARDLHGSVPGVAAATVWLVSRIGAPVDRPLLVAVEVIPHAGADLSVLQRGIPERIADRLARVPELCHDLEEGRLPLC